MTSPAWQNHQSIRLAGRCTIIDGLLGSAILSSLLPADIDHSSVWRNIFSCFKPKNIHLRNRRLSRNTLGISSTRTVPMTLSIRRSDASLTSGYTQTTEQLGFDSTLVFDSYQFRIGAQEREFRIRRNTFFQPEGHRERGTTCWDVTKKGDSSG